MPAFSNRRLLKIQSHCWETKEYRWCQTPSSMATAVAGQSKLFVIISATVSVILQVSWMDGCASTSSFAEVPRGATYILRRTRALPEATFCAELSVHFPFLSTLYQPKLTKQQQQKTGWHSVTVHGYYLWALRSTGTVAVANHDNHDNSRL